MHVTGEAQLGEAHVLLTWVDQHTQGELVRRLKADPRIGTVVLMSGDTDRERAVGDGNSYLVSWDGEENQGATLRCIRYHTPLAAALHALDEHQRRGCSTPPCQVRDWEECEERKQVEQPDQAAAYPRLTALTEELGVTEEELTSAAEYLAVLADVNQPIKRHLLNGKSLRTALHDAGHPAGLLQITRAIDRSAGR